MWGSWRCALAGAPDAVRAQIGTADHYVVVSVPADFIESLSADLEPFLAGTGHVSEEDAQRTLGRCGRLAYLIPAVRPFVAGLWGAWAAAGRSASQGSREAPPGRVPAVRFQQAARWIHRLLNPPPRAEAWLPLEHLVTERLLEISLRTAPPSGNGRFPVGRRRRFVLERSSRRVLVDRLVGRIGCRTPGGKWPAFRPNHLGDDGHLLLPLALGPFSPRARARASGG